MCPKPMEKLETVLETFVEPMVFLETVLETVAKPMEKLETVMVMKRVYQIMQKKTKQIQTQCVPNQWNSWKLFWKPL